MTRLERVFYCQNRRREMEKRDEYYVEAAVCDAILCALIGGGLAYVLQQWWFA
jgi:hypothetical protein